MTRLPGLRVQSIWISEQPRVLLAGAAHLFCVEQRRLFGMGPAPVELTTEATRTGGVKPASGSLISGAWRRVETDLTNHDEDTVLNRKSPTRRTAEWSKYVLGPSIRTEQRCTPVLTIYAEEPRSRPATSCVEPAEGRECWRRLEDSFRRRHLRAYWTSCNEPKCASSLRPRLLRSVMVPGARSSACLGYEAVHS
jgi:hypothetical protein